MTVALSPIGNGFQFLTAGGLILSGGLLWTYAAGTSTPQTTYTTSAGNVANPNPIVLGPDGRPPGEIWLSIGVDYKFVLLDSLSNPVGATLDNIRGISDFNSIAYTDPGSGGFWPDITSTAKVVRLRDRVFVGGGAAATGNRNGTQGWIVPTSTEGANWASRDSQLFVGASTGLVAISGFARASDDTDGVAPAESIGVAGFVINNAANAKAWGLYSDLQREVGAGFTVGLEVAAKNKGADTTAQPYSMTDGCHGIWLAAGGDSTYGGVATNPSDTAVAIVKSTISWNKGIVFEADSLTGCDGVTGVGTAIQMARGMRFQWLQTGGLAGAAIRSDVDISGRDMGLLFDNNLIVLQGASGSTMAAFNWVTNSVNRFSFTTALAGASPVASATGTDTDIDWTIQGKGSKGFIAMDGAGAIKFRCNTTGVGFFAATPVAKPTLAVASSDLATVITLANDIRTRLINYGLAA